MKKLFFLLAVMLGVPLVLSLGDNRAGVAWGQNATRPLEIYSHDKLKARFRVEVADNDKTRAKGLMFRRQLADDSGMLFQFDKPQVVYFWMKDTYLSLDMIFIDKDGRITNIAPNTTPLSEAMISSNSYVKSVLEIKAGLAKKYHIMVGDRILLP